jgi:methionyl-tRNA formyltransferase
MKDNILVATIKSWNCENFSKIKEEYKDYNWYLITNKEELTYDYLNKIKPAYVFFPHWSWIIPKEIYKNFNCIVFHMTDLPFGRGGSPLQNLIERGFYETKISAIKVVGGLDAGPVYLKENLSLHGNAEEIYIRASDITFKMIGEIMEKKPEPVPQEGDVIEFKRRKPEQSELPMTDNLRKIYDYIRMLDAESYPSAYIDRNGLRFEFERASLKEGYIKADVIIKKNEKK